MLRVTAECVCRPQNARPVFGAVGRNRQDRPALPGRSDSTEYNLALWVQQVAVPVERDGTKRIILGPHVDEFLRASVIVRSLTMHVRTGAHRDGLLHLGGG